MFIEIFTYTMLEDFFVNRVATKKKNRRAAKNKLENLHKNTCTSAKSVHANLFMFN